MKHPDIVPYSQEEGEALGRVLTGLGVPSIGPGIGTRLVEQAHVVGAIVADDARLTPEMKQLLAGYQARLMDVALVGYGAAAEVIEKIKRAVQD